MEQPDNIEIADRGRIYQLNYDGLMAYHGGDAVFGATAAFRALQAVEAALSRDALWDRQNLHVISAHSGPGVRDAIEYVTRCVTRDRYTLVDPSRAGQCHSENRFVWWVRDAQRTVSVELRSDFVPEAFMALADRIGSGQGSEEDLRALNTTKQELSDRLWSESLDALFTLAEGDSGLREQGGAAEAER